MIKLKTYAVLLALLAVAATLTLAACSEEMSNAEIRTVAESMGMVMAGLRIDERRRGHGQGQADGHDD